MRWLLLLLVATGCGRTFTTTPGTFRNPVAAIDAKASAIKGDLLLLDGQRSFDPHGQPLTYAWRITGRPSQAKANLSSATEARPTLKPDWHGRWELELVVTAGGRTSATAAARIEVLSSGPVANAGLDRTALPGVALLLDGSGSFDPEGAPLSYQWRAISKPAASMAAITGANLPTAQLVGDVIGDWEIELEVTATDGRKASDRVLVRITGNRPPDAVAGPPQSGRTFQTVTLDGSASSDPEGSPLTYFWEVTGEPMGSSVTLSNPAAVKPTFVPRVAGSYALRLRVTDVGGLSDVDLTSVQVAVGPAPDAGGDRFDPDEVYVFGNLSEMACDRRGIAHWSSMSTVSVGFGCSLSAGPAFVRSDGRLLYGPWGTDLRVHEFFCDACPFAGTYPANVTANDRVVPTPCPTGSLDDFLLGPDGRMLHQCSTSLVWRGSDGGVVYDAAQGRLVALGAQGWALTRTHLVNVLTGERRAHGGLPLGGGGGYRWSPPASFLATTGHPGALFRISLDGGVQTLGAFPDYPVGHNTFSEPALDARGVRFDLGTQAGLGEHLLRRTIDGGRSFVFVESAAEPLKIQGSRLVTGP